MWPTLLNFQRVFCHASISATSDGTSASLAVFQRLRMPSSSGEGLSLCMRSTRECKYFAISPRSFAAASTDFRPSLTCNEAVKYPLKGSAPPLFLSSAMPCCVTVSEPPSAVNWP